MDRAIILEIIQSSIADLIEYDNSLIDRKVKEECINHRLAVYIERNFYQICPDEDVHVDLEYDKNLNEPKQVLDENGKPIEIRPDILVHWRYPLGSNDFNLIALEAKKSYFSKHDDVKIRGLLKQPFNYPFGFIIVYRPEKISVKVRMYERFPGEKPKISCFEYLKEDKRFRNC